MQPDDDTGPSPEAFRSEAIAEPAKLVRVIDVTRQVLDELHHGRLDQAARTRVQTNHHEALQQLRGVLPESNQKELDALLAPLETEDPPPSGDELRLAEAQLLGWLEGLLKGMEADEAMRQAGAQARQVSEARQAQQSPSQDGPEEPHRYR